MVTLPIHRSSWALIALVMLLFGCKKSTDDVTAANSGCQLQAETNTYNGGSSQTTTYTYNGDGQLMKTTAGSSIGTPATYTYSYDATGNLLSVLTQGMAGQTNYQTTSTYEYSNGRLTKITSKTSSDFFPAKTDTYSYDPAGHVSTYVRSSADAEHGTETYGFTNGVLTSAAMTRSGRSLTVDVANGRITHVADPNGQQIQYTYDANGYVTRVDYFEHIDILQSYTVYTYSAVPYKEASTPYQMVPVLELYGSGYFPHSRDAIYGADGSLQSEVRFTYQVNSEGYITSNSYVQTRAGVSDQTTYATTYAYSNCP